MAKGGVWQRGHSWRKGGMHDKRGGMCGKMGACIPCMPPHPSTRYGWSMGGRYTSYWNAFLFRNDFGLKLRIIL